MPAVILLDQHRSRRASDLVESWRKQLVGDTALRFRLPFERTAGDEMEALVDDPRTLAEVALRAIRSSSWWLGIGVGSVDEPLPHSVRAAHGQAFVLARRAIEETKARSTVRVRVLAHPRNPGAFESALFLMAVLYSSRPNDERNIVQLREQGLNTVQIARTLGITKQAVSKHLLAAHWTEEQAGRELVRHLAEELLG